MRGFWCSGDSTSVINYYSPTKISSGLHGLQIWFLILVSVGAFGAFVILATPLTVFQNRRKNLNPPLLSSVAAIRCSASVGVVEVGVVVYA